MGVSFPPEVEGLIQAIERDHFVRPEAVLGPLRQLLQRCADRDQIAYVCEKLGFAHLRLGEHQMSRIYYEHALRLQPENFYILANLAHALFELGDRAEGVDHGRRALLLKDQSVMAAGPGRLEKPHGGSKRLISFSLYGDQAKYCETAVLNCIAARRHFPGYVCRFHIDQTGPSPIIRRLQEQGAEIVVVKDRSASVFPTAWRFLPLDDRDADIVLVRDVDSLIDAREASCVHEWIASGKPFHIIRDDCCHTELILAGLFAARAGVLGPVKEQLERFMASPDHPPQGRYADQLFLRQCIWPRVRNDAVTHDRIYGYGTDVRGVPAELPGSPGPFNHFMGAAYATYQVRVTLQEPLPDKRRTFLRILDERGGIVCEHPMERVGTCALQILLPPDDARQLESGQWKHQLVSTNAKDDHP
ncbi:MAG TPA: hypothetical protein DDY91_18485 [Planctomycetaceae bacterium]|nr:hypothetical protein [Planctomycetaceae bacterium]